MSSYAKQFLRNKLLDHKTCIHKHGEDLPEMRNWKWSLAKVGKRVRGSMAAETTMNSQ